MEFNPPYRMQSKTAILFCFKKFRESSFSSNFDGYKPIKIFGFYIGNIILNKYARPFPELNPYDEIIYATLFRKGFKLLYVAEKLILNDEYQTKNGIEYYHLPKVYDPNLSIDFKDRVSFISSKSSFNINYLNFLFNILFLPIRFIFSFLVCIFTALFNVIGVLKKPYLVSKMELRPSPFCSRVLTFGNFTDGENVYFSFWGQYFKKTISIINRPHNF